MKFKLPDFDTTNFPKAYVVNRLRIATATDVHFVSDTKILVASLANKKIYFIDGLKAIYAIFKYNFFLKKK